MCNFSQRHSDTYLSFPGVCSGFLNFHDLNCAKVGETVRIIKWLTAAACFMLITGCVEHIYHFQLHPDGGFDVQYFGKGSIDDFQDSDYLPHTGPEWTIRHNFEQPETDTHEYSAQAEFDTQTVFPGNFFQGDSIFSQSLLNHQIHFDSRSWWVKTTYKFTGRFPGRNVTNRYPLTARLFNDEPADGWAAEYLTFIFTETLDRCPVSYNLRPIVTAELERWISENISGIADSLLVQDFYYLKRDGLDVLMRPLPVNLYTVVDSVFKMLDDEGRITRGLADDNFEFRVLLPGDLEETNADTIRGDTLIWQFGLAGFLDNDLEMTAVSKVVYPIRYRILFALLLTGLVLVLIAGYRYGKIKAG